MSGLEFIQEVGLITLGFIIILIVGVLLIRFLVRNSK